MPVPRLHEGRHRAFRCNLYPQTLRAANKGFPLQSLALSDAAPTAKAVNLALPLRGLPGTWRYTLIGLALKLWDSELRVLEENLCPSCFLGLLSLLSEKT
jgi:hypothetical protein